MGEIVLCLWVVLKIIPVLREEKASSSSRTAVDWMESLAASSSGEGERGGGGWRTGSKFLSEVYSYYALALWLQRMEPSGGRILTFFKFS